MRFGRAVGDERRLLADTLEAVPRHRRPAGHRTDVDVVVDERVDRAGADLAGGLRDEDATHDSERYGSRRKYPTP
jgi:hypothetical protein